MEFISPVEEILAGSGEVEVWPNNRGISMNLIADDKTSVKRVDFGAMYGGGSVVSVAVTRKRDHRLTYRDATISEILALAERANEQLPEFKYTQILQAYASVLRQAQKVLRS